MFSVIRTISSIQRQRRLSSSKSLSNDALKEWQKETSVEKRAISEMIADAPTDAAQSIHRIMSLTRQLLKKAGSDIDRMTAIINQEIESIIECESVEIVLRSPADPDPSPERCRPDGLMAYVQATGRVLMLNSLNAIETHAAYCPDIDGNAQRSVLLVPVIVDDDDDERTTMGVIRATDTRSGWFSSEHQASLQLLADCIGHVVAVGRQFGRSASSGEEPSPQQQSMALLEVARALSSQSTIQGIVSLLTHKVQVLLQTERCTMFLMDRVTNELVVWREASHGVQLSSLDRARGKRPAPDLPFESHMKEIRMPSDKGIAGYVVTSGQKLNVTDAYADPRFNPEMDRLTGFTSRSILCMPMRNSAGAIVGAIQAINKDRGPAHFTRSDEDLLETFAAHAAIALENFYLLTDIKRSLAQSDAMLEVTKALSRELQLGPLVRIIVEKVHLLLNVERCTVFICDHAKRELYTTSSMSFGDGRSLPINNETDDMIRIPMNQGVAGHVALTGETVIIADAYADPRFSRQMDIETGYRTRNILCMSIRDHKNIIVGVVQVINKRHKNGFADDDIRQLGAFSAQAAVAISNSRLYQETERALNQALCQVRNLKFMLNITKHLSNELQTSSMMFQMQSQLSELLKADHCFFFVVEPDQGSMYRLENGNESGRLTLANGISGYVAQTAEAVKIQNKAQEDPRYDSLIDSNGAPCESIICMPIVAQDEVTGENQVLGLISVQDETHKGGFGKEEEALLTVFCAQAAVALSNSRKFLRVIDDATCKQDVIAAEYLQGHRGMQLGGHEIDRFAYSVDEIYLTRKIGVGSFGEVWLAKARGEIVAVKKIVVKSLQGEQIDAFCSEASLMCQLKHPNVVEFKGAVTQPPSLCIITEFCARGSLAQLLADRTFQMSNRIVLQFVKDIARGMHYLHTSNPVILHRDLKSDNLLVDRNWNVKVADFGLTRFMDEKKKMTQVGTPIWMSPEVCTGEKYTEKADVYAFGIIMWEILTREEPYQDKEMIQIVLEVVNKGLRPRVDDRLQQHPLFPLITDCWHQIPDRRPNFKAILERLDHPDLRCLMDNDREPLDQSSKG